MENEEGCTIHLKVRMENDELVDKAILCPSCGGEARTFKACDGDGACYALLACMLCGNPLAACATDEEMERNLEEIWREGKDDLLPPRKRSEEHTPEIQSPPPTPSRPLTDKKKKKPITTPP